MSERRRRHVGILAVLVAAAAVVGLVPGGAGAVQVDQSTLPSANPIDNTPRVQNGSVYAIVRSGGRVFVGGSFTTVQTGGGGANTTRNRLFSYSHASGQLDSWNPNLSGAVEAIAVSPDGQWVYAGGSFGSAGGSAVQRLERWNTATGARDTSFNPNVNGSVRDLDLRGNILYIAGNFTTVNGATRERLAAVDATTGSTLSLNVPITEGHTAGTTPNVVAMDVSADGRRLVAVGNFRRAGGADRRQLAVLDLDGAGGGSVSASWRTAFYAGTCSASFTTYMRDVDISPDGTWFVAVTTGAWRGATSACDVAARFQLNTTGTDVRPLWTSYTGGDTLLGVGVTSEAVYIGGHQRWTNNSTPPRGDSAGPGAVSREGIAALDPASGVPLTWNPGRQRGVGCEEITTAADAVYIGHDTNIVAGETRPRLTAFPMTGESTPDPQTITLPAALYQGRTDGTLRQATLGPSGVSGTGTGPSGGLNWSQLRGAFVQRGQLYAWNLGGTAFTRRSFDGASFGPATDLVAAANYVVGPPTNFTSIRAAAYADGRIFYLRTGSTRLYWRWFSLQSGIVGSSEFTASTANWSAVTGIEAAGSSLYATRTDGRLYRYAITGSSVGSSSTLVDASTNWNSGNDLFLVPGLPGVLAGAQALTADPSTTTTTSSTTTTTTSTTTTTAPPAGARTTAGAAGTATGPVTTATAGGNVAGGPTATTSTTTTTTAPPTTVPAGATTPGTPPAPPRRDRWR